MITFKKWQQLHEGMGDMTLGVSTPPSVGIVSNLPSEGLSALEEARKKLKKKMLAGGYKDPEDDDDDEDNNLDRKKVADDEDDDDDDSGKNAGGSDSEAGDDDDEAQGEDDGDSSDSDSDPRVKKNPKKVELMKKKMKKESSFDEGGMPPWLKDKGTKKGDDADGDGKSGDKDKGMPSWMGGKKKGDDSCDKSKGNGKGSKAKDASDRFKKIKDKVKDEAAEAFDDMFFASLTDGIGKRNEKFSDGWTEYQNEEALLAPEDPNEDVREEPKSGEVGYAPTGRYGQPLGPQVAETKGKAKKKK